MNRLLRNRDYKRQIQNDTLQQIIENDYTLAIAAEQEAQLEMRSYLLQRYDVDKVFTNTTIFATSSVYYSKNLVEYTEPEFDYQISYNPNDRISFNDKIYYSIATASIIGVTPDDTQDWKYLTDNESLYYANLPIGVSEYSNSTTYPVGVTIWYNDIEYISLQIVTGRIPPSNPLYWQVGITYSFSNIKPDDTSKWTKGDNRNQQIVMYLIDITLYHLHSRLNPRNIPTLRVVRYDGNGPLQTGGAIGWLKHVAKGNVNAEIPTILPTQNSQLSMNWGSSPRNNNFY